MGCTDERDKRALHLGHDRVAGQSSKDAFVESHGLLKTYAVTLSKLANDIRLLGSGPRGGIGELKLPAVQPGSSIMPGKVNPVICESVIQVCCRVLGNDTTLTTAAFGGVGSTFELNTCMPLIIDTFLESTTLLTNATHVFVDNCLAELTVNEARCRELLDRSLMAVTALVPTLGYDVCADLAKQAHDQDKTIRQVVLEHGLIPEAELDALFDFDRMTRPHSS
jgi:fumarate hydratase class II